MSLTHKGQPASLHPSLPCHVGGSQLSHGGDRAVPEGLSHCRDSVYRVGVTFVKHMPSWLVNLGEGGGNLLPVLGTS